MTKTRDVFAARFNEMLLDIRDLTENNYHNEALISVCECFKDHKHQTLLKSLGSMHREMGYMTPGMMSVRSELSQLILGQVEKREDGEDLVRMINNYL